MPILDRRDMPAGRAWPDPAHPGEFLWFDFESETEMSADGSGDPDMHYLTIAYPDGEEMAMICHHHSDLLPIDGEVAVLKQLTAQWIIAALNAYEHSFPTIEDAREHIHRRDPGTA